MKGNRKTNEMNESVFNTHSAKRGGPQPKASLLVSTSHFLMDSINGANPNNATERGGVGRKRWEGREGLRGEIGVKRREEGLVAQVLSSFCPFLTTD